MHVSGWAGFAQQATEAGHIVETLAGAMVCVLHAGMKERQASYGKYALYTSARAAAVECSRTVPAEEHGILVILAAGAPGEGDVEELGLFGLGVGLDDAALLVGHEAHGEGDALGLALAVLGDGGTLHASRNSGRREQCAGDHGGRH